MQLKDKLSPLSFCFRKRISPIIFKEYCNFFNIDDRDRNRILEDLRHRGYSISFNFNAQKQIKINPRKALLESFGVKSF